MEFKEALSFKKERKKKETILNFNNTQVHAGRARITNLRGTQFQGHSRRAPKATVQKNTIEV